MGSPLPHCAFRLVCERRHQVVSRGRAERVVQLRRSLGVQKSRQGEQPLPIRRELCRQSVGVMRERPADAMQGSIHAMSDNVRNSSA